MSVVVMWTNDAGAAISAIFDIDEQETHDLQNVITEHPVEESQNVTDNVRPQLNRFTLQGFVTDTPLYSNRAIVEPNQDYGSFVQVELQIPDYPIQIGEAGLIQAGIGAVATAIFGKPKHKATLLTFDNFKSRKRAMFSLWKDARDNARICRVITSLNEYDDMIVEQVTVTRAPGDGNGAVFSISFKQIEFVTSETVGSPEPSEVSGASAVTAGSKNSAADSASTAQDKDTVLLKLVRKAVSLVPG